MGVRWGGRVLSWVLVFAVLAGDGAVAAPPLWDLLRPSTWKRKGIEPESCVDPAIETLAANVDWLEHHVAAWGSVAPKTPDVWGEARLTKYRREVELVLADELDEFEKDRISGSQAVTDTAFLAAAVSLDSRATLGNGLLAGDDGGVVAPQATVNFANVDAKGEPVTEIEVQRQEARPIFGGDGQVQIQGTFGVEQVAQLDQLKRYLDHLNELRRINEGDDDADSPGYSLNLVRIPVSVMPGSRSRQGYGAEITFTATPVIDDGLLPKVFQDLVINDLVDQLSVPLTLFLNQNGSQIDEVVSSALSFERSLPGFNQLIDQLSAEVPLENFSMAVQQYALEEVYTPRLYDPVRGQFRAPIDLLNFTEFSEDLAFLVEFVDQLRSQFGVAPTEASQRARVILDTQAILKFQTRRTTGPLQIDAPVTTQRPLSSRPLSKRVLDQLPGGKTLYSTEAIDRATAVSDFIDLYDQAGVDELFARLTVLVEERTKLVGFEQLAKAIHLPNASTRKSTLPYPPRHLAENIGFLNLAFIVQSARLAFSQDVLNRQVVHLTDVQGLLREELTSAYRMLSRQELADVWDPAMADQLVTAIRLRRREPIRGLRESFMARVAEMADRTTPALAWAVFVESVLLDEQLHDAVAQELGLSMNDPECGRHLKFYGPRPDPPSADLFARYVAARWPLKIFTIDPVATEQNVADSSSVYRQMQLAVSLAFSSGNIGVGGALSMMRAIQRDIATIDLNRVAVGFAHGADTFGWRFYPRFQTPPVEGNLTVLLRDLVAGGPTDRQLLRKKELEPGMRECVAVIITPSFVSDMVVESRSAWFRLDKPGHVAPSNQETVRYSRNIVSMRQTADTCVRRPDLYRDGEVGRLLTRVRQLDRSLPLQTLHCNLPTENTLGGFELLASGRRELAPELLGWYGSPGYDAARGGAFFLAGDNFSVHETRVIAGNTVVTGPDATLISRQVMEVRLPPGLPIVRDERIAAVPPGDYGGYIDVHVASPYGVSGHLLIPVVRESVTRLPSVQPASPPTPTAPTLLGHAMEIDMTVEIKNESWSVTSIKPQTLSLATVQFADVRDVPAGDPEVTFTPMSEHGALSTFTFDDVSVDANGTLAVGGAETLGNLSGSGKMRSSLKTYVEWLLSVVAEKGTLATDFSVTIPMTATVAFGSDQRPTLGTAEVVLRVKKKDQ